MRGDATGPLAGLPMTIKDCWEVAGLVSTDGDPRWRPLLQQVQGDRERGFDAGDRPRPGALEEAREFAAYAAAVA